MPPDTLGRLFLAVPLTDETRDKLRAYVKNAGRGRPLPGRVVPADNWHLTLRFLGDTSQDAYARLLAGLATADLGPPFNISFNGLGAFPKATRAKVLWLAIDSGRPALTALAVAVEAVCVQAGFAPEDRAFSAHLTLSRLQAPADLTRLVSVSPPSEASEQVAYIALYRSHPGRGPAHYEVLHTFPLVRAT